MSQDLPIEKLKDAQIKRAAQKAGIPTLSSDIYDYVREYLRELIKEVIHNSMLHTHNRKQKTVTQDDILEGIKDATGCNFIIKKNIKPKVCKVRS